MKLLCVEDNSEQRQVIDLMLAATGIDVDFAENGQEAIEAYQENEYAAVLMDIEMPVMSGIQAAHEIRQIEGGFNLGYTPILFISGHGALGESDQEREAGGDGHLAKPFTCASLLGAINQVLRQNNAHGLPLPF